jgi:hypothetical protein
MLAIHPIDHSYLPIPPVIPNLDEVMRSFPRDPACPRRDPHGRHSSDRSFLFANTTGHSRLPHPQLFGQGDYNPWHRKILSKATSARCAKVAVILAATSSILVWHSRVARS